MCDASGVIWRECVDWMIRCEILQSDHRITNPSSDISDFAHILRDGVLLCQLANRLKRGSIDTRDMALRPQQSQFLCLKNICLFLHACSKTFCLAQADLFEAMELYCVSNFGQILMTLSKLSFSPEALQSNISGFPERNEHEHDYYNDDIYRSLAEEAESRELTTEVAYNNTVSDEEEYGKIYDVIVSRSAEPVPETTAVTETQTPIDFPKDKRGHCIRELIDTEERYVDALNMLTKKFYTPLREILKEDHSVIFMNLAELHRLHATFLVELRQAVIISTGNTSATSQQQRIGDIFVRWKLKFVKYSDFCSQLPFSQSRIDQLCAENSAVRNKIIECQADANQNRFRLQDLLSVPMQRVLKYPLLLKELVKLTPSDHPDCSSLVLALDAMKDISQYINEVKRDSEQQSFIRDIENSIEHLTMPDNTTLCDYGRLLKDGEIRMCSHEQDKKGDRLRYVFIFDKVMLICKPSKSNQHTYKDAIVLSDYTLDDNPPPEAATTTKGFTLIRTGPKWTFGWSLIHREGKNVIQMYAQSEEQKRSWIKEIENAHDNVRPEAADNVEHIFVYTTFEEAYECSACDHLLKGFFYQGYKCQKRGCVCRSHKECIARCPPCGPRRPNSFSQPSSNAIVGNVMRAAKSFCSNHVPEALTFREGDTIDILSIQTGLEGWWKGKLSDSTGIVREGIFPAECVRKIRGSHSRSSVTRANTSVTETRTSVTLPPNRTSTSSISTNDRGSLNSTASRSPISPNATLNLNANSPPSRQCSIANNEYRNLDDLSSYPWSVGNTERIQAESLLKSMPRGTFLVRFSEKQLRYAISVSYENDVKHVKIEQNPSGYWLDEGQLFHSVVELVQYYEKHNMRESFQALDTVLRIPIRQAIVGVAEVKHDFEATANNMVSLKRGDRVVILCKNNDERGWWKGKVGNKIGYFPLAYVSELDQQSINDVLEKAE